MTINHLVLLRFKPEATLSEQTHCIDSFAALQKQIPEVLGFEQGPDVSPEGRNHGFSHAASMTFANAAARDVYLIHPAHLAFVSLLKPVLDDVLVFDIEI